MSKKVIVLLGGCGHQDGTEIQEAVLSLTALQELGYTTVCVAPDRDQAVVIDHTSGDSTNGSRSLLREAARIARGQISPIAVADPQDYVGLVIPGGTGCARNFCDYATKGPEMTVAPDVGNLISNFYDQKRPICAICIAPAIVARVLGKHGVTVTIGSDASVAGHIAGWGAEHADCPKGECIVDLTNRLVTTPAYMYGDSSIPEVFSGIRAAIGKFHALVSEQM